MKNSLEITNLSKSYKNSSFKLDNVSFNVPNGSIMGFVGKNGAGKTTTINAILNIISKDSGTVNFFGQQLLDSKKNIRNDIAVVFDATNFSGNLTPSKLEKVLSHVVCQ